MNSKYLHLTGFLVSVVFLLLPRHLIRTACDIMLFYLLLLHHVTARVPLHEHFFARQSRKEVGTDYGYVDAYSEHVTMKASKHGSDYGYEYRDSSDEFRSGGVDPEVGKF